MVRIKHRYLLVNILYPEDNSSAQALTPKSDLPWPVRLRRSTPDNINARVLISVIRKGVEDLFGDYGSGMIAGSLVVKYFSAATSTAIIRVARAHYRMLWAALSFVTSLANGQPCVIQVVRVSGTIKKSEEEAIRRARLSIIRAEATVGRGKLSERSEALIDVDHIMDDLDDDDDGDDDDENE